MLGLNFYIHLICFISSISVQKVKAEPVKMIWKAISKLTDNEAKTLHERQAPDAWDSCESCPERKPGFLVRLKMEDGSYRPGIWVPTSNIKGVTYNWNEKEVTTTEFTKYNIEYLWRDSPSISWVTVEGDGIKSWGVAALLTLGKSADGKMWIYPCRAFQDDQHNKLIIGRYTRKVGNEQSTTGGGSGGCLVYEFGSGKEILKKIYELPQINAFGVDENGVRNVGGYSS